MPRYSKPMRPDKAAVLSKGKPGNYILNFTDGSQYAGRQGKRGKRVRTHVRKHGKRIASVQFMGNPSDNPCTRATRERQTVKKLQRVGAKLRNKVFPDMPQGCPRKGR